ncbi:MAG: hypothetical protein AAGD25_00640 [Cyanobacteria bacterium P01_F01_bin.150]
MTDIKFWKPAYQLFKHDVPLMDEDLKNFYVRRDDSPVDSLVTTLTMEDQPAKFLLSGHRGGGKTTELKRLEAQSLADYTVVWVDTELSLEQFNIGYAEVIILIGKTIVERLAEVGWKLPRKLEQGLLESLAKVTYEDKLIGGGKIELPKLFTDLGLLLRVGFDRTTTRVREVRPALSDIVNRVNTIIEIAEADTGTKLLVMVDGLDRKEREVALEMFSSSLLTSLSCHIVYVVPISLRYSTAFQQPMENFSACLDLDNIPVFKCNDQRQPTVEEDRVGRHILKSVIAKRLGTLGDAYKDLFAADALELMCEKSGGVMRDLVRLARMACTVASKKRASKIDVAIVKDAIREVRRIYSIEDYHFPELVLVHRTGKRSSNTFDVPSKGTIVICDELLHHRLILGYRDPDRGRWFDVHPILMDDLNRWQAANPSPLP